MRAAKINDFTFFLLKIFTAQKCVFKKFGGPNSKKPLRRQQPSVGIVGIRNCNLELFYNSYPKKLKRKSLILNHCCPVKKIND